MLEGRENESKNETPIFDWIKVTENSGNAKSCLVVFHSQKKIVTIMGGKNMKDKKNRCSKLA